MNKERLYTCLACGFKTLKEVPSEDEICKLCSFHETSGGMEKPVEADFPGSKTLTKYQEELLLQIPIGIKEYKKGGKKFNRNPMWKPINITKLNTDYIYFSK